MPQIHQVEEYTELKHDLDPVRGMVLRSERKVLKGGTVAISHPDYDEVFEIGPDGSFDVPDDVAAFLVKQPSWFEGPNPFQEEFLQKVGKKTSAKKKED